MVSRSAAVQVPSSLTFLIWGAWVDSKTRLHAIWYLFIWTSSLTCRSRSRSVTPVCWSNEVRSSTKYAARSYCILDPSADRDSSVLAELEACSFRNKTHVETAAHIKPFLEKYLPLSSNTSGSSLLQAERQKDHYSHFILRLAFSGTEDLRRRFARVESTLFRIRFQQDDVRERQAFIQSLTFDWESVGEEEKRELATELLTSTPGVRRLEEESWFKVDWERVPELVEGRRAFLKHGKAYVPIREQISMVVAEFTPPTGAWS